MRVAYIGYDIFFPALQALYDCGCNICKIFTCPTNNITEFNLKISQFAKSHGIPVSEGKITPADLQYLKAEGCDFAICGAYFYRIPVIPDFTVINIHPSYLPNGRGAWPMPHTILRGDSYTGVSFHIMTEQFDTGDIILQRKIIVDIRENLKTLTFKICSILPHMIQELLDNYHFLMNNTIKQVGGTYEPNPTASDWTIHYNMSKNTADCILRAFYGFECIYIGREKTVEIIGGRISDSPNAIAMGLELSDGWIEAEVIKNI